MKVLFCTNAFEKVSNGPAKFAHLLLEGADNAGFEIRILTEDVDTETTSVYKLGLRIFKPFKIFGVFIRMVKYHRAAMRIRREYNFDFLVYNNAMIGLFSFIFFKKTVGMINDYSNAAHSLVDVMKGKARLNKRILFFYVERLTCFFSTCIIVNSEYLKRTLQRQYHYSESLFKVLYKGIEERLLSTDRVKATQTKVTGSVLFVKTDFELGGLYNLIDALKNIDRKVKLTIVGPAKKHHEMLEGLLIQAQIPNELFDYLKQDEVYTLMQRSEIFCVPSKREAFGVANLEALALGCKIVTTEVGGIPEAMNGNRFAWLVSPDDPIALREAIVEALDTPIEDSVDVSNHLGQFASAKMVSNFRKILQECF